MPEPESKRALVLLVSSGDKLSMHHALSLGVTAATYGEYVTIALFWEALDAWVRAHRGSALPLGPGASPELTDGVAAMALPAVQDYARHARALAPSQWTVVACGASAEALGLAVDAPSRYGLDDIWGLPTIWRRAKGARVLTL